MPPLTINELGQGVLAGVSERRVPNVVTETHGFRKCNVERQRPGDRSADLGDLERVSHPGHEVIALRVHEDLGLVLQAPERL